MPHCVWLPSPWQRGCSAGHRSQKLQRGGTQRRHSHYSCTGATQRAWLHVGTDVLLLPSTKKAGVCSSIFLRTADASCQEKKHVQCTLCVHVHVHVHTVHVQCIVGDTKRVHACVNTVHVHEKYSNLNLNNLET